MKSILIIVNALRRGGAERIVVDDIKSLTEQGYEVTLLTLLPERQNNSMANDLKGISATWKLVTFKSFYTIAPWFNLILYIKKLNPDVLITHLWYANTIGRIAGRLAGVRKIITFEQNVYDNQKSKKQFLADRILQFLSSDIIAVSRAVKESLLRNGIQKKRITVISNGVDLSNFQDVRPLSRSEVRVSENDFVYVFVGSLTYQKAVDTLIKAFAQDVPGKLLIVGDGALRGELESLTEELNIKKKVIFLGIRDDIPRILPVCDCFILPSRYEGLGIVVLEAMASEVPVIVSDFPARKEMVRDGENGLVVPIDDTGRVAKAMKKMYEDEEMRKRFIEESKMVVEQFSQKRRIGELIKVIES